MTPPCHPDKIFENWGMPDMVWTNCEIFLRFCPDINPKILKIHHKVGHLYSGVLVEHHIPVKNLILDVKVTITELIIFQ